MDQLFIGQMIASSLVIGCGHRFKHLHACAGVCASALRCAFLRPLMLMLLMLLLLFWSPLLAAASGLEIKSRGMRGLERELV